MTGAVHPRRTYLSIATNDRLYLATTPLTSRLRMVDMWFVRRVRAMFTSGLSLFCQLGGRHCGAIAFNGPKLTLRHTYTDLIGAFLKRMRRGYVIYGPIYANCAGGWRRMLAAASDRGSGVNPRLPQELQDVPHLLVVSAGKSFDFGLT